MDANLNTIGLHLVDYCDKKCVNCASFCDLVRMNSLMSLEQINRFVDESFSLSKRFRRIRLVGGEPTLYPHLPKVFEIMKRYRERYPTCIVDIATNGIRKPQIPPWIKVRSSQKTADCSEYDFVPILDNIGHRYQSDGCFVVGLCGLSLTAYGYYPCDISSKMDMLLGWDIGVKTLKEVNQASMQRIMNQLCKHCGWTSFKTMALLLQNKRNHGSKVSPFWRKALDKFDGVKLSLY